MTKIETVKALDDTEPQLAVVASIRAMEASVKALQTDLAALPSAVASETAMALQPLMHLRRDLEVALTAFDQLLTLQRDALGAMRQELAQAAAAACSHETQAMAASSQSIAATSQQLVACRGIAGEMQKTANAMQQAAWEQQERARRWLSPWWQAAAIVTAALLAAIGATALGRLWSPLPSSSTPSPTEQIGNPSH